jgi:hypothetical protein
MKYVLYIIIIMIIVIIYVFYSSDPLPSWNKGSVKSAIMNYVDDVTNKHSNNYINVEDRIATFDNDGNLWSEKPMYFQYFFAIDQIKKKAVNNPQWKNNEPFRTILTNDQPDFMSFTENQIKEMFIASHSGTTTIEFEQDVLEWLETSKHPRFNVSFNQMIYQPMLELINYLKKNNFTVYIVSGGGLDFIRPWVESTYGIPKNHVIGSTIKTKYRYNNGSPQIIKLSEIDNINNKSKKPENIHKHIGRIPVFSSGNSDEDLEMMRWTDSNIKHSFKLYLHHTDDIREWAYDRQSHIGKLNVGLKEAAEKGWIVTDMKKDWKIIYPFEK